MVTLTGLMFVKINFGKIFARFLTSLRKFVFATFFYFTVCSFAGKTFRVKIEIVFISKKNIFLDKSINAN